MSQLALKKKVLEFIIKKPGVTRGDIQIHFNPTYIGEELQELFVGDKAYSLGSNEGCFPEMNAEDILQKSS